MLYNQEAAKANIRNRAGKRVFFLGQGDTLTPSARDWLTKERIDILPAREAAIHSYRLPDGGETPEKPEQMTHLRGNILVEKTHPVIAFRGAMDTLQAEILLAQPAVDTATRQKLEDVLTLCRNILRWEVMEEPVRASQMWGLSLDQIRQYSHFPQDHYGQPHFMPSWQDGAGILQLNKARCAARAAELAAAHAFAGATGSCRDLIQLLNRISSMLYLLMIQEKAKG